MGFESENSCEIGPSSSLTGLIALKIHGYPNSFFMG
jgi:hypothetical protein